MEDEGERSSFVVGLIENRAQEVGVAAFDLRSASLHLSQYIETSSSYQNTKTLLNFYDPIVIIVPPYKLASDGMVGVSELVDKFFSSVRKAIMARGCFDDTKGAVLTKNLAAKDLSVLGLDTYYKQYYLCLAAAAATIKWIEAEKGVIVTNHSLSVTFNGSLNHVNIDATSVQNLEIIDTLHSNLLGTNSKKKSLFHMLKTTKTIGGTRLLRANLLQPLKDIETIEGRLDCLDELMSNEQLFFGLSQVLRKFPKETDRVLCHFCFKPRKVSNEVLSDDHSKKSQVLVASIILLKTALDALPLLSKVLKDARSFLLRNIYRSVCESEKYGSIRKRIGEVIDEDVLHARAPFVARTQQCFAIKAGIDGFLDVARRSFCDTSEAIHNLANKYREELKLPNLKLPFNNRQGFYIRIPHKDVQGKLPSKFIQVVKHGNNIHCSTLELASLNVRNKSAAGECYARTAICLEALMDAIREDVGMLTLLAEALCMLDMIVNSFAHMISTKPVDSYTRPKFTSDGPLAIDAGRHPILESIHNDFVANNVFLSEASNMVIVTGPNMSGKSTYLQQVCLTVILAQIGCYVPARFTTLRVVDLIFTRMNAPDSIESNSSTFMTEMRETAFIMQNISSRSLIIMDELGRATSSSDGFAIAWSCCEHLLSLKAYTIFATHMENLVELATIYPNVKILHFYVDVQNNHLDFKFQLKDGPRHVPHYGLLLAEVAGLPSSVITAARSITARITEKEVKRTQVNRAQYQPMHIIYGVAQRLICLKHSSQKEDSIRLALQNLQESFAEGKI
uniref:DNA mismatch repair protein MSH4 n=2 Tax=Kalanchoe fedtschenkoi TaxID=63787 RepID=A0A7N0VI26_KALFE